MYTSANSEIGTVDLSMADLIATAPKRGAGTLVNAPLNYCEDNILANHGPIICHLHTEPTGVLEALKIYALRISRLEEEEMGLDDETLLPDRIRSLGSRAEHLMIHEVHD